MRGFSLHHGSGTWPKHFSKQLIGRIHFTTILHFYDSQRKTWTPFIFDLFLVLTTVDCFNPASSGWGINCPPLRILIAQNRTKSPLDMVSQQTSSSPHFRTSSLEQSVKHDDDGGGDDDDNDDLGDDLGVANANCYSFCPVGNGWIPQKHTNLLFPYVNNKAKNVTDNKTNSYLVMNLAALAHFQFQYEST